MNVEVAYNNEFMRCGQRHLRPSGARGGKLTPEGHEGWSTVWGLGGGDKTLNTRRIQL